MNNYINYRLNTNKRKWGGFCDDPRVLINLFYRVKFFESMMSKVKNHFIQILPHKFHSVWLMFGERAILEVKACSLERLQASYSQVNRQCLNYVDALFTLSILLILQLSSIQVLNLKKIHQHFFLFFHIILLF